MGSSKVSSIFRHFIVSILIFSGSVMAQVSPNYFRLIHDAQKAADNNHPQQALILFQNAAVVADDQVRKRVALFGMAKMQLWLKQYVKSAETYRELLREPLAEKDKTIALKGLSLSIQYQKKQQDQLAQLKEKSLLASGERNFDQGRAKPALHTFKKALVLANNEQERRAVLFHIAAAYLENEQYAKSLPIYKKLMDENLSAADYEVALNGYVRSESALNRPMKAYLTIPKDFHYTSAGTVIAAAQAAVWSGWEYKAKYLLNNYANLVASVNSKSYLYRQLNDVISPVNMSTDKNAINYNNYFQSDNEGFDIQRHQLQYSRRFNSAADVTWFANQIHYSGPGFSAINATTGGVQSRGLLNDFLSYSAGISSGEYNTWSPVLWDTRLKFTPNDIVSLSVNNSNSVVESMPALANQISMISSGLGVTVQPVYRLSLYANVLYSQFSDNNTRPSYYGKLSYLLFPSVGLYADGLVRSFQDAFLSPNYFSPSNYFEDRIALRLVRRFLETNARYYLSLGFGQQKIDNGLYTLTQDYRAGVTEPFTNNLFLNGYYGYSNSAADSTLQTSSYAWQYGGISLTYVFI